MKRIIVALFVTATAVFGAPTAHADQVNGSLHGKLALRLYDTLERTGIPAGSWTDNQGVKHYTLNSLRKVICDYNTHTDPNPAQCIILEGFMSAPRFVTGDKARNVIAVLRDADDELSAQGLFIGDCAMGRCSEETAFLSCYFAANAQDQATCDITQGNPF